MTASSSLLLFLRCSLLPPLILSLVHFFSARNHQSFPSAGMDDGSRCCTMLTGAMPWSRASSAPCRPGLSMALSLLLSKTRASCPEHRCSRAPPTAPTGAAMSPREALPTCHGWSQACPQAPLPELLPSMSAAALQVNMPLASSFFLLSVSLHLIPFSDHISLSIFLNQQHHAMATTCSRPPQAVSSPGMDSQGRIWAFPASPMHTHMYTTSHARASSHGVRVVHALQWLFFRSALVQTRSTNASYSVSPVFITNRSLAQLVLTTRSYPGGQGSNPHGRTFISYQQCLPQVVVSSSNYGEPLMMPQVHSSLSGQR